MGHRTLLVVSQRPLDLGGGGSGRWRHLRRALAENGWQVVECSPRVGVTAKDMSTDPRVARLAARRARLMEVGGHAIDPIARMLGVKPEAFALNNAWALTGRRLVREAIRRERPDVVVATTPPISALFATAAVNTSVPWIAELRDLWAGSPYFDRGGKLLPVIQRRALERSTAIVTVTDTFRDRLLALHAGIGPQVHVLPNGFESALLDRRVPVAPRGDGLARLVFAGALYGEHTAEPLIEALRLPQLQGRAQLELVGIVDGRTRRAIVVGGVDASIDPPVSWEEAINRTLNGDVAVVITTSSTGGDMAIPGKLYEVLALGRPVLAIARTQSETARLLTRLGQDKGLAPPEDPEAIAAAIERLLADPPPPVPPEALAEFDRDRIAARYAVLLDEVATRSSSATSSGTTTSRR